MFERLRRRLPGVAAAAPETPRAAVPHEFEVLSIAFELDVRLCQLQLTSFDRFFDLDTLAKFTVIVNGGEPVLQELRRHAETLSPRLREKLVLVEPHDLRPGDFNSWRGQQILKLIFARRVETSHYLVLDSKNHLVKPASAADWFDERGRGRTVLTPTSNLMRRLLIASYEVFELDADPMAPVMPTITPYLMQTDLVKAMMREVGQRAGVPFVRAFRRVYPQVGEFFLYYAYLLYRFGSVDDLYYDDVPNCVTLFTTYPETAEVVHRELDRLADPEIQFFGLHRNRLPQLDDLQRERITQVWHDAGLLTAHPAEYYLTPLT
ncbi:DUF6492 family protein [Nocardioides jishulii]|uniref:Uncharacterized protein n=1 Tax=Nocardioides jishulii TaxID=2575440 RepID=A0A4V5TL08_9ACTN|nr:DUF6492 family protein [Nocardioides jishulii]QCX28684.1 hypothetical protein FCL41_14940 [Nocardioides jishulii]TKI64423.1 hypothetical protein FC770_04635 [Nocardioides jishulii]